MTQRDYILNYYIENPNREIHHKEIVDIVTVKYENETGKKLRDPDRMIRQLGQQGYLIQIKKGVYKYDPDFIEIRELEDFTAEQKKIIFEKDNYRCVICGRGIKDGLDIYADHIIAKDKGGKATIENGQTLCGPHNNKKKNFKQTETGKKMFIHLYELAKKIGDLETMKFCSEILEVFEKNDVNGHIVWKK